MVYSYFPGCTLKSKATELDRLATKLSSVRALADARDHDRPLLTLCSACHNVIKQVNNDMLTDDDIRTRANNYLQLDEPYGGETKVVHYLEVLRDTVGFDELKKAVVSPLKGKKIAAYYGCLLLRPGAVMAMDDPENPSIIEDFIKAIGAEPVIYPQRNECCGGYLSLSDKEAVAKRRDKIVKSAKEFGCDCIITACPLCMYNLAKNDCDVPVLYFTELLAQALGVE